ncbi:hypothetical protein D3C81_2000440 [compost metagenome]
MKIPSKTPNSIPPAAPKLIEWFPFADGPEDHMSGIKPATNAKEVIKMGRKRNFAPATAES